MVSNTIPITVKVADIDEVKPLIEIARSAVAWFVAQKEVEDYLDACQSSRLNVRDDELGPLVDARDQRRDELYDVIRDAQAAGQITVRP